LVDIGLAPIIEEIARKAIETVGKADKEASPQDAGQIAKCVAEIMTKFLEEKSQYVKVISRRVVIDQDILVGNLTKMSNGIKVHVKGRKIILGIPVAKSEYSYSFDW
jgi:hypothetical protein